LLIREGPFFSSPSCSAFCGASQSRGRLKTPLSLAEARVLTDATSPGKRRQERYLSGLRQEPHHRAWMRAGVPMQSRTSSGKRRPRRRISGKRRAALAACKLCGLKTHRHSNQKSNKVLAGTVFGRPIGQLIDAIQLRSALADQQTLALDPRDPADGKNLCSL